MRRDQQETPLKELGALGGLGRLDQVFRARLAADEAALAEAQEQAALRESSADRVLLAWRQQAVAEIAAQRGLPAGSGLSFGDQALANERVQAIAARAKREREAGRAAPARAAEAGSGVFRDQVVRAGWPGLGLDEPPSVAVAVGAYADDGGRGCGCERHASNLPNRYSVDDQLYSV
jgi:hypothetical protein